MEKGFESLCKIGESITHKTYGNGKVSEIDGKHISIIFKGGIERKFDIFVLKNSGLLFKN